MSKEAPKVTKSMTFDAAHLLTDYRGDCSNLHGHTYTVQVTVQNPADIVTGFIIDYNELEKIAKEVIKPMDHAFIVGKVRGSSEEDIKLMCEKHHLKIYELFDARSTSECIAKDIQSRVKEKLPDVASVSVKLWETPTSFCEV